MRDTVTARGRSVGLGVTTNEVEASSEFDTGETRARGQHVASDGVQEASLGAAGRERDWLVVRRGEGQTRVGR